MHYYNQIRRVIIWSLCLISTLVFVSHAKFSCHQDQKDALWDFKNEFYVQDSHDIGIPAYMKIERWRNNTDCCSWDGVSCDSKTGKVIELNLINHHFNGPLRSNSSLFRLHHLQSLFLSSNNFSGTLPSSIGNLKYLRVLRLGGCNFFGKIPSSLGNLSYLTVLHLSNDFTGELPDSIGNLNRLEEFQFVGTKLGGNFPHVLLNLSELSWVDLRDNQFEVVLPSNISMLSKMEMFDISGNSFSGSIPPSLFMIPSLIYLELESNYFTGPLEIGNISSPSDLEKLYMGENNFNGPIPEFISKLVGLRYLDLSFWNVERGMVDLSIFLPLKSLTFIDMSYLNTRSMIDISHFLRLMSLSYLDLSGNNLKISSTLHLLSPIKVLALSSCNIAEFPLFLQNKSNLTYLDISANHIEGQVPEWLWRLPLLRDLNISQNSFSSFEGSADVIQKSGRLTMLDISSNTFQDPFPLLPTSMRFLSSSNNRFSGNIPRTICSLVSLDTLDLSNNNFNGSIPLCFNNFNTTLSILHLRNNSLSSDFPEVSISNDLRSLDVGHNLLSGKLPRSLFNCTRLEFLNVEDNKINDTFPFLLTLLPNLQILVLRSNNFHGPIYSRGDTLSFPELRIFDISKNHFTGVLPSDYFEGWIAMSSVVEIVDGTWLGYAGPASGYYHKSVGLSNKGSNMELIGIGFTIYKAIDISENKLKGDIPESIGLLKELIVLNMSSNAFTGHITLFLANLINLQSLDLSGNRLSGRIPPELGKLTFLAWMNFSYNMLEGPIPQTAQFQSQNNSSFAENLGLCGIPLEETCGGGEEATKEEEEDEEKDEPPLSWIAAVIGYVPGVFCGLTIGHIVASYKRHLSLFYLIKTSLLNHVKINQ